MNTVLLNNPCNNLGNVLKTYREKVGIKQSVIANRAGISTSMLSQIERSVVSPSIDTLYMVCVALGLDMANLFSILNSKNSVRIHHDQERLKTNSDGVIYEQLEVSNVSSYQIEMFLITIEPNYSIGMSQTGHEGIEIGYVLMGCAQLIVNDIEYTLKKGDSVTFNSSLPHSLKNRGDILFRAVWNVMPPHKDYFNTEL